MGSKPFTRLEEILEGFLKPAAMMLGADDTKDAEQQFMLQLLQTLSGNLDEAIDVARNRQKKFVWCEFCLTPELFLAFDLYPFIGEIQPAVYSKVRQDFIAEFIDAAENSGIPPEVCSIDKVLVGAILQDEMPTPDLIVTTSAPCDSSRIGYQIMEKLFDAPVVRLDAPFTNDAGAMKYYADQIRSLIPTLEKLSGKRFDVDRLREVVEESNRALNHIGEWHELRRLKPCPTPANILMNVYLAFLTTLGHSRCTEFSESVYRFARRRIEEGFGNKEKIRVIWQHVPSLFDDVVFNWMEQEFGAVVVDDMMSGYCRQLPIDTSSLDSMLLGLAQRGLNMTMGRLRMTAQTYVSDFLKAYHDYLGDCAILSAHAGCKHCWGAVNLLREAARRENIPLLIFDFDFLDSRVVSTETVQSKIGQFFETMGL
ncbi:2-hydroxyacyl-CoA dehydratase [Candidatus Poribacteria bacterium]|nr:2-hydroxyacyl-CoA dehydratase [Candidatus Poribacteria bacterium]